MHGWRLSTQKVCHGEALWSRTRCMTRIGSTGSESDGTNRVDGTYVQGSYKTAGPRGVIAWLVVRGMV